MSLKELQKYIKEKPKSLIFGSRNSIRNIKLDNIAEIFLANDSAQSLKTKIFEYSKFSQMKVIKLDQDSSELSAICGKRFPISIIGVLNK